MLLQLDHLSSMALSLLVLSLAEGVVLGEVALILALEEGNLLRKHLQLACRLSLNVLGNFLVFCQTSTFKRLNLILQLLVLILHVGELLRIMLRASGALALSKSGQLRSHLPILL